jgi:hypothetical protein
MTDEVRTRTTTASRLDSNCPDATVLTVGLSKDGAGREKDASAAGTERRYRESGVNGSAVQRVFACRPHVCGEVFRNESGTV